MNQNLPTTCCSRWQRLMLWLRLKMLERELRNSRHFQNYCQKINCKNLAELEGRVSAQIHGRIKQLKINLSGSGYNQPIAKNLLVNGMRSDEVMTGGSFWVLPPVTTELENNTVETTTNPVKRYHARLYVNGGTLRSVSRKTSLIDTRLLFTKPR